MHVVYLFAQTTQAVDDWTWPQAATAIAVVAAAAYVIAIAIRKWG